jgi:hypothetical protein
MRKLLTVLLLVLVPAFALALPNNKELKYKATKTHDANSRIIKKGIEGAIEDMSFITRPIARGRLEKSNKAFKTITVKLTGKKIMVRNDGRKPVTSPSNGSKVKWTREDGETFNVSQKVSDTKIVQIFYAEDGKKTLVYDFSDDFSKLKLSVTLESPKLSGPLKYTLAYAKQ